MFKKALIGAVAIALSTGVANAGENKFTKEEGVGMGSGAAIGAVVGGPIGAFVGLMVGGILGDSVGTAKRADLHAKQLEQELIDTRVALAKASESTGGDEMLDRLAEQLHADVMFRTGSSDIDSQVAAKLEALGALLAAHGQLEIQLNGFADPRGTPEQNLELSLRRADAVREALIRGGVTPEQIRLSAHGEDLTTAAKDDIEAYAWERRVSLAIRPVGASSESAVAQAQ
ncbi:outer membrane protein OmpA-like peptidoglycan-associated protein [Povalibacter uvarum]|uniref:Outer membrane protein OmpA-like peptidoglycan-associated protein n=1 Tax=Povalibacter uvarum TaxID=732238 RepID=A0A841HT07_9GAMM|nr:OmpA family protein [Povalibacter uvarum]MBB6095784.1 outer membrane protein OmpA-like peptidoglycan-associated protein [Povalibacter uvarum]